MRTTTKSSLILVLCSLSACASVMGPSQEEIDRERAFQEQVRAENTDRLVELFVDSVWSKSGRELFEHRKFHESFSAFSDKNFLYANGERRCQPDRYPEGYNSSKRDQYGEAPPHLYVKKTGGEPTVIQGEFGFRGVGCTPGFLGPYNAKTEFSVEDADTFRERMIAAGVPLLYCVENPQDRLQWVGETLEFSDDDRLKTLTCLLPDHPKNEWGNWVRIKVGNNVLGLFDFHLYLHRSQLERPIGDEIDRMLSDQKTLKDLQLRHTMVSAATIKDAEDVRTRHNRENAEVQAYLRAYQRRVDAAGREMLGEAVMSSLAESNADHAKFDSIQSQTMKDIRSYQAARATTGERASSGYKPRDRTKANAAGSGSGAASGPKSGTTNGAGAEGGKLSNYEAEKQNCLNAGKKWDKGCDYSTTVEIQGWKDGNRAVVQPTGQGTRSTTGGATGSRTNTTDPIGSTATGSPQGTGGGSTGTSYVTNKTAEALCRKTKSGNFACDGPMHRDLSSWSTIEQALKSVDCVGGRRIQGTDWYDCGRLLKTHDRDVRDLVTRYE